MAGIGSRMSMYSNHSLSATPRPGAHGSTVVSTTTLLNALHTSYTSGQPYFLESSTSLVVNTWVTSLTTSSDGGQGGVVDSELGRRAWEHARRRAEDGCIVLGSLHQSTPSLLHPFVGSLPLSVPSTFYTALSALRPFLHCVTPQNPATPKHSALAATFTLSLVGELTGTTLSLSTSGIDVRTGLLNIPAQAGYRAFDVFYYLLTSASNSEREYLNLKPASAYELLRKSETYAPPSYLPSADDAASADDFRESLKAIGIKGASLRNLLSVIAAILRLGDGLGYLVDENVLHDVCEEVADLLDLDTNVLLDKCDTTEREALIIGIYEAMVDWVISKANEAMRTEMRSGRIAGETDSGRSSTIGPGTPPSSQEPGDGDTVAMTVIELPNPELGKAIALRTVFDDSAGINAEMKEDGVPVVAAGSSVLKEMRNAVSENEHYLDISGGIAAKEREYEMDSREGVLEKVGTETEEDSFLRSILYPVDGQGITLGRTSRFNLASVLGSSRVWFQLALHPTDDLPASLANNSAAHQAWSAGSVSSQIRAWRLPEWANHRNRKMDFTADFDLNEFVDRYARLGCQPGRDGAEMWIVERGWSNGEVIVGTERIWMCEAAWCEAESMLDMKPVDDLPDHMLGSGVMPAGPGSVAGGYQVSNPMLGDNFYAQPYMDDNAGQMNPFLSRNQSFANKSQMGARSIAPTQAPTTRSARPGDYGLGPKGDAKNYDVTYYGELEDGEPKVITEQPITRARRVWVAITWALTFWIPSFLLRYVGRMKRPDVRMAWREKLTLMFIIFLMNGIVLFYIIAFGRLLCPNFDKAWNAKEVGYHTGNKDWYVSFRGGVYDLSKFWKLDHSDTTTSTSESTMEPFGGTDVSEYIRPPLTIACPGLVTDTSLVLGYNTTLTYSNAEHLSGPKQQTTTTSALYDINWYTKTFLPKMKTMYKGELVISTSKVKSEGENQSRMWFRLGSKIYDLTDYFYTVDLYSTDDSYQFFPDTFTTLVQSNPGEDIQQSLSTKLSGNVTAYSATVNCLNNMFFVGHTDFRESPRCQVNNYILLAFTIILCAVILIKFLSALQFGSKRRPAPQDKFVICQVPAYTEGEDQIRKGLDSLTALSYDNKRKLLCVICDGMITGGGNDRPTPKIVLDILGVDPKIDPPALPFKSVGTGSEQLNYGKVYSGLYEYEGNVVPYLVIVKVGKESEQTKSKPGNRGKRDSQILLMSFLNRVHHRAPMSPLELEMFHQINNVIGVDPELYEYMLMVDADTTVAEDALTRLVASCANDAKIAGICGETSLENEERSWWTMIQVYEYYISHHLAKAFESLFGSVTCLPGCFTMYRLRTVDKGKPLIISDAIIEEYSDCVVDTLHKKNLLSLGEDRFLTTLMLKHFPQNTFKFVPDAHAHTAAPEDFSVLLSQRRRWINSTIHNLAELMFVKDMCGFCCFSMRFVVFVDLFGTVILPATCVYLLYLIIDVAVGKGQFPLISIIMIAGVYGLQAIIFLLRRQWQHIGWMIVYLLAFPIYSFVLPIYSFWKQDDFSWGNTRVVLGEKGNKQVVAVDEEGFDPRSIPLQRWDDYATVNNLPGRRGYGAEKDMAMASPYYDAGPGAYEMDDLQSSYSSMKPASTILTGFPHQQNFPYRPPTQSPGPQNPFNAMQNRASYMSTNTTNEHARLMSMGARSDQYAITPPPGYATRQNSTQFLSHPHHSSSVDLLGQPSPYQPERRSPLGYTSGAVAGAANSRPVSTVHTLGPALGPGGYQTAGVTDAMIVDAVRECLAEVDLDNVTKKQLKALTEQRLQTQLGVEKRAFLDGVIDAELANM